MTDPSSSVSVFYMIFAGCKPVYQHSLIVGLFCFFLNTYLELVVVFAEDWFFADPLSLFLWGEYFSLLLKIPVFTLTCDIGLLGDQ